MVTLNLCILSSEKFYDKNSLSLDEITPYIDPCYSLCSDHSPYVQSDNRTPVLFSQLKLVKRYATENVLNKVLKPYKIKQEEIEKWFSGQDHIANYMSERQMLHNEWANYSNKKGKNNWFTEDSNMAGTNKKTKYKTINQKIEEYNWLDNKIHLVHVKKLHNLLLEILARLVGFVALWERDFQFINNILSQYGFTRLPFTGSLPSIKGLNNWQNFMSDTFVPSCASDYREYRNFLAHFNYLTQFSGGSTSTKSLLKLIEDTRKLVSYDRKLKNAVTKSIIDIIDRHGIELAFKPLYVNSHQWIGYIN